MKKGTIIALGIASCISLTMAGSVTSILIHRNVAVSMEESISAQYTYNKSNYDYMIKTAKETVQVTDMYAEDFERIYKELIEGRNKDTNLLFKVVQESNPQLDTSVYKELQRTIASNRKIFDKNQGMLTDKIREYNTYIKKKFIMSAITNRTPMDAEKFIVTSQSTQDAFNTGMDKEINLRGE